MVNVFGPLPNAVRVQVLLNLTALVGCYLCVIVWGVSLRTLRYSSLYNPFFRLLFRRSVFVCNFIVCFRKVSIL